jgi:hypothetical protein
VEAIATEPFSFWNFIEPEDKEAYWGSEHGKKPEGYEDWSMEQKLAHDLKFSGNGWYDWNCREWGTKWDACEVNVDEPFLDGSGNASVSISFDTAWGIPEPVFKAMVQQHPELSFDFDSEEEQGWGAKYTSSDGDAEGEERSLILTEEWDIPDCHEDFVSRGKDCWRCDSGDPDDLYDDCPRDDQDFYVVVTKTYRVRTDTAENAWELAQDNDPDELMELIEDETNIQVRGENGERLFPTLNDGKPEKVCDHKFVPLVSTVDGERKEIGTDCVFCHTRTLFDTTTASV